MQQSYTAYPFKFNIERDLYILQRFDLASEQEWKTHRRGRRKD
jgi:hypothetical protein